MHANNVAFIPADRKTLIIPHGPKLKHHWNVLDNVDIGFYQKSIFLVICDVFTGCVDVTNELLKLHSNVVISSLRDCFKYVGQWYKLYMKCDNFFKVTTYYYATLPSSIKRISRKIYQYLEGVFKKTRSFSILYVPRHFVWRFNLHQKL